MTASPALDTIRRVGIIPVVRVDAAGAALRIAETLAGAGIGIIEITMTVPGALDVIAAIAARFGQDVLLGAGTITTGPMAGAAIDAGAAFLVTPCLVTEPIAVANRRHVPIIAGALTPTEVFAAAAAGADLVKVFPVNAAGGPSYLRALKGPLPAIELVPTGSITLESVPEYFAAGAFAIGVGGELIRKDCVASGDFAAIAGLCRRFLSAVASSRR